MLLSLRRHLILRAYHACSQKRLNADSISRKGDRVLRLVYSMCESDVVEKLMSYNFAGFSDEVQDALSFKARNVDPRSRPFYSRILYSWFISRGDYRNGMTSDVIF
jgi:hypothetical protein